MAEKVEKWTTVTNKPVKKGQVKQNGTKLSKDVKAFLENAPRIEPKDPIKEEKSIYDVLQPKEKRVDSHKSSEVAAKAKPSNIPRLKKEVKTAPKLKLETLVEALSPDEFKSVYDKSLSLFKGSHLQSLKEITGLLNSKLDEIPQPDPMFENKPKDFPLSLLASTIQDVFNGSMKLCTDEHLLEFLDQLVQSMMKDMAKGSAVFGYQMVAQILAHKKPHLFTINIQKDLQYIITNKNFVPRCLLVMWTLGQCGLHDFKSGLKVWLHLMLPLLGMKTFAPYAVAYIGQILQIADKKAEQGYGVIEMKHYFLILDGVFTSSNNLQVALQGRLKELHPVLKRLAFGKAPEVNLPKFFPSFLARLSNNNSEEMQQELLDNLVKCSALGNACHDLWRQMYSKHLPQSSIFLKYLCENWNKKCSAIDCTLMLDTVAKFTVANSEFSKNSAELTECRELCKKLEETLSSAPDISSSRPRLFLFLILLSVGLLVGFDVYQHGSYPASKTKQLMRDSGVEAAVFNWAARISLICSTFFNYVNENYPAWVEKTMIYIEPAAHAVWSWVLMAADYIVKESQPLRDWLLVNIPVALEWVVTHPAWEVLSQYYQRACVLLQPYLAQFADGCLHLATVAQEAVGQLLGK